MTAQSPAELHEQQHGFRPPPEQCPTPQCWRGRLWPAGTDDGIDTWECSDCHYSEERYLCRSCGVVATDSEVPPARLCAQCAEDATEQQAKTEGG